MVQEIRIADYDYPLPEARIARYPLAQRDDSKLLVYTNASGRVPENRKFRDLAAYLPEKSLMVFNNTKVVPARLLFQKDTGALIEIFCLEPADPEDYELCFATTSSCSWKAIVGNAKRWKEGVLHLYIAEDHADAPFLHEIDLTAELIRREGRASWVRFAWKGGLSFSQVMDHAGRIPIPPYLRRDTEPIDLERYQTWYARREGSVAAPTAGLHFTQRELDDVDAKGIRRFNLCLHVGAGTFKPVKSEEIEGHEMHTEWISVSKSTIESLIHHGGKAIAVGTTSVRTLESLYHMGVTLILHPDASDEQLKVKQWQPYELPASAKDISSVDALQALLDYMNRHELDTLHSSTQIIIAPGYQYQVVKAMVTNFHQPQSTLLLLVSAFVQGDWHTIYDYALSHNFRFLSYGDSSFIIP